MTQVKSNDCLVRSCKMNGYFEKRKANFKEKSRQVIILQVFENCMVISKSEWSIAKFLQGSLFYCNVLAERAAILKDMAIIAH